MRAERSAKFPNLFRPDFGLHVWHDAELRFEICLHHSIQRFKLTKEQITACKNVKNRTFGNTLKMDILDCAAVYKTNIMGNPTRENTTANSQS